MSKTEIKITITAKKKKWQKPIALVKWSLHFLILIYHSKITLIKTIYLTYFLAAKNMH